MDEAFLLARLEGLLGEFGVELRRDRLVDQEEGFELRSGDCQVRGRHLLVLDRRLPPGQRLKIYRQVLLRLDLGDRYLPPRIREFLGEEI